jgi:hypothetical protein
MPTNQDLIQELNTAYGHFTETTPHKGPWRFENYFLHERAEEVLNEAHSKLMSLMSAFDVPSDVRLSLRLILEEHSEFVSAYLSGDSAHALEELVDTEVVNKRVAVMHGWDTDKAFTRKHEANMSKLVDGRPVFREDGKVIKGPNYVPADFSDLV